MTEEIQVNESNRNKVIHQLRKQGFTVHEIITNVGYSEKLNRVMGVIDGMDTDISKYYLKELYEDRVIYQVSGENRQPKLYSREYIENADGTIELTGEPIPVMEERNYVELQNNEKNMSTNQNGQCSPEKVDKLIGNSTFTGEDKDWLMKQGETAVDKMLSVNAEKGKPEDKLKGAYEKPEDVLDFLSANARKQVEKGLNLHKEQRDAMIANITTNSDQFKKDELEAMEFEMLQKVNGMIKVKEQPTENQSGNYVGQAAGGNQPTNNEGNQDEEILLPPEVEDK